MRSISEWLGIIIMVVCLLTIVFFAFKDLGPLFRKKKKK